MKAFPAEGARLQGSTLILPVVAVGNVGQLAADLLINTFRLDRSARLADDALLPAVGSRSYGHVEGIATAMELYRQQSAPGGAASNVAVVQQRAPAAPGTQEAFAERLAAFVQQSGAQEVLVLGSIEAAQRREEQLAGPQLRCWAPEGTAAAGSLAQRCSEAAGVPLLEASFFDDRPLEQRLLPPWPLLLHLKRLGVPCAALVSFSTEGDNLGEAAVMATAAAAAAGLSAAATAAGQQQPQWVPPHAWQYVYGASPAVY